MVGPGILAGISNVLMESVGHEYIKVHTLQSRLYNEPVVRLFTDYTALGCTKEIKTCQIAVYNYVDGLLG